MNFDLNKAIEFLLARGNLPILYWLKKDILEVPVDREYKNLKKFAARIRILKRQKPDGGWHHKIFNGPPQWKKTYHIVITLRNILELYKYGCNQEDEEIQKAAQFLFSTQSQEGYFWNGYIQEYMPTYHAITLEILCMFGWDQDPRTQKGFEWLLNYRQNDGGWAIPYRTLNQNTLHNHFNCEEKERELPLKPDRSKPSSPLVTGIVLRALAASNSWRNRKETKEAGKLLMDCFFQPDEYEERHSVSYWQDITYPFWGTDILSSMDSLSKIGFGLENEEIQRGLDWLSQRQKKDGYWEAQNKKSTLEDHLWVTLAILRVIKRFGLIEL